MESPPYLHPIGSEKLTYFSRTHTAKVKHNNVQVPTASCTKSGVKLIGDTCTHSQKVDFFTKFE